MEILNFQPIHLQLLRYPVVKNWGGEQPSVPYWRFYWNDRLGGTLRTEGQAPVKMDPNMYYIIPRHTQCIAESSREFRHLYALFHVSIRMSPGIYAYPLPRGMRDLITRMIQRWPDSDMDGSKALLGYQILYRALEPIDIQGDLLHPGEAKIGPAFNHLLTRVRDGVSNRVLAEMSGMSVNSFVRLFKEVYGTTPQRYLVIKRCERVNWHLEYGDQSLEWIAERTGFCDRFHMSKVFKRERGVTPAVYRRHLEQRQAVLT